MRLMIGSLKSPGAPQLVIGAVVGWVLLILFASVAPAAPETEVPNTSGELPSAAEPDLDKAVDLIVERTNRFRKKKDREPVTPDENLTEAARQFAEFMATNDKYGHQADGRKPHERISAAGYDYCFTAENIALQFRSKGFKTEPLVERFVQGWINSEGHRENMLNRAVTETGVAIRQSDESGKYYAVQLFGRPQSAAIKFKVFNTTATPVRLTWANKSMEIPARAGRILRMCQPGDLKFFGPADEETEKSKFESEPFAEFPQAEGKQYRISADGEGFRVDVAEVEGEIEIPNAEPTSADPSGDSPE